MDNVWMTCFIILYVAPAVIYLGYTIWAAMNFQFKLKDALMAFVPGLNLLLAVGTVGTHLILWALFDDYVKKR